MNSNKEVNCDLGESDNPEHWQHDAQLMPYIDRCNIACGGHAGTEVSIRHMLQLAKQYSVLAGPHPSYPDKSNFGRISMDLPYQDLVATLMTQLTRFKLIAEQLQVAVSHVKCHGALYNDMERSRSLAQQVCELINQLLPGTPILGLANGVVAQICQKKGFTFIHEGFIDRRYTAAGILTPRTQKASVLTNTDDILHQAERLLLDQSITADDGSNIDIKADSLCLHGDTANSATIALKLHQLRVHLSSC